MVFFWDLQFWCSVQVKTCFFLLLPVNKEGCQVSCLCRIHPTVCRRISTRLLIPWLSNSEQLRLDLSSVCGERARVLFLKTHMGSLKLIDPGCLPWLAQWSHPTAALSSKFKHLTLPQNGIHQSTLSNETAHACTESTHQLLLVKGPLWEQNPTLSLQITATTCLLHFHVSPRDSLELPALLCLYRFGLLCERAVIENEEKFSSV